MTAISRLLERESKRKGGGGVGLHNILTSASTAANPFMCLKMQKLNACGQRGWLLTMQIALHSFTSAILGRVRMLCAECK